MKKNIVMLIIVSCLYSDSGYVSPSNLSYELESISNEISAILKRSDRTKKISIKFSTIASSHKNLLMRYEYQSSTCANYREMLYYISRSSYRYDDVSYKLRQCNNKLKNINIDFQKMNINFARLENKIQTMKDLAEVDMSDIPSLEKQLDTIKSMLEYDKARLDEN